MESKGDNYDVTSGAVIDQPPLLGTLKLLSNDAIAGYRDLFWLLFRLPNSL